MPIYQNRSYQSYKSGPDYSPKKAVKNFTDLEVYQKSLELSVFVANEIVKSLKSQKTQKAQTEETLEIYLQDLIIKNILPCALSVPHMIAESHSKRFGSGTECLDILDQVMLKCNKMVVYLEQVRDICETGVDTDRFDEQIKKYFYVRRKVLNLQRVWRKYIKENEGN